MMKSKSGGDQTNLISALKFFGFIDADNTVLATLRAFVPMNESERKVDLGTRLRDLYPEAFKVSDEHGSETALYDCFTETYGYAGDTRRRRRPSFSTLPVGPESASAPTFRQLAWVPDVLRHVERSGTPAKKVPAKRQTPQVKKRTAAESPNESVEASFGGLGSATLTLNVPLLSLPETCLQVFCELSTTCVLFSYDEMDEDELYEARRRTRVRRETAPGPLLD